jgi:hypothetical protein
MKNKKSIIIILFIVLFACIGTVLLINNSVILTHNDINSISLTKQYLKTLGFLSIMGLVYVSMKGSSKNDLDKVE